MPEGCCGLTVWRHAPRAAQMAVPAAIDHICVIMSDGRGGFGAGWGARLLCWQLDWVRASKHMRLARIPATPICCCCRQGSCTAHGWISPGAACAVSTDRPPASTMHGCISRRRSNMHCIKALA
jgi:hypothetical protein